MVNPEIKSWFKGLRGVGQSKEVAERNVEAAEQNQKIIDKAVDAIPGTEAAHAEWDNPESLADRLREATIPTQEDTFKDDYKTHLIIQGDSLVDEVHGRAMEAFETKQTQDTWLRDRFEDLQKRYQKIQDANNAQQDIQALSTNIRNLEHSLNMTRDARFSMTKGEAFSPDEESEASEVLSSLILRRDNLKKDAIDAGTLAEMADQYEKDWEIYETKRKNWESAAKYREN